MGIFIKSLHFFYLDIITHNHNKSHGKCSDCCVFHRRTGHLNCILLYLWCSKDTHQELEEEKRKTEHLQKYVFIYILILAVKTVNMFVTKLQTHSYTLQREQRIAGRHWKKEGTVKKVGEFTLNCYF